MIVFSQKYISVYGVILKQHWRVLYSDFEEFYKKSYFFNIWQMQSEKHHRNPKTMEVLFRPRLIHICQKFLILSRDPVPLIC
jgi:hypothetical protein